MYQLIILLAIIFLIIIFRNNFEYFGNTCSEKPKIQNLNYNRRFGDILVYKNKESVSM